MESQNFAFASIKIILQKNLPPSLRYHDDYIQKKLATTAIDTSGMFTND
jgi:hypothetical protein